MYIDDTFEIQIKTMFFEGWHEIEHDMRYKGEELWKNYKAFLVILTAFWQRWSCAISQW